ncbi:hypothetical protein SASPL_135432 [Salvia splendens]|uniref:Uncharacterized protein n=1 Tax=Salvia splendens TaxID=180675 RepID=A0A8X8WWI9_SALSN|nr:hypothetical protein SASPL_135432 [Salvia splendens]
MSDSIGCIGLLNDGLLFGLGKSNDSDDCGLVTCPTTSQKLETQVVWIKQTKLELNHKWNKKRVRARFGSIKAGITRGFVQCLTSGKKRRILDPQGNFLQRWNKIFVLSCIIAVSLDPLFFYIPVIIRDQFCLSLDRKIEITACILRGRCVLVSVCRESCWSDVCGKSSGCNVDGLYCLGINGGNSLDSLGQNLKTSIGLILFSLLIGNMQKYLQSITTRVEEMRVKRRDAEQWMSHRILPEYLRARVRRYEQYIWQENRGRRHAYRQQHQPVATHMEPLNQFGDSRPRHQSNPTPVFEHSPYTCTLSDAALQNPDAEYQPHKPPTCMEPPDYVFQPLLQPPQSHCCQNATDEERCIGEVITHTHSPNLDKCLDSYVCGYAHELRDQDEEDSSSSSFVAPIGHSCEVTRDFDYYSKRRTVEEEHCENLGSMLLMDSKSETEVENVCGDDASNSDATVVSISSIALLGEKHGVEEDRADVDGDFKCLLQGYTHDEWDICLREQPQNRNRHLHPTFPSPRTPTYPQLVLDQKPPLQHVLDQQPQPSHRRAAALPAPAAAPPPPLHMDQQRPPSRCHPTTHLRQAEACLELPSTVKQPLLQRPLSCLHPPSLHSATKLVSCEEKYLGIEGNSKVLNQVDLRLNEKKLVDEEVRAIEVDKIDDDDGLHDSSKIAIFDFDGCLAKTSVKGVKADTWSIVSPSIPEKLHNRCKDELHDAREDTINGLKDMSIYSRMGVKRMGELDNKPFHVIGD